MISRYSGMRWGQGGGSQGAREPGFAFPLDLAGLPAAPAEHSNAVSRALGRRGAGGTTALANWGMERRLRALSRSRCWRSSGESPLFRYPPEARALTHADARLGARPGAGDTVFTVSWVMVRRRIDRSRCASWEIMPSSRFRRGVFTPAVAPAPAKYGAGVGTPKACWGTELLHSFAHNRCGCSEASHSLRSALVMRILAGAVGETWCWGFNFYGQLGDGTRTNRSLPVRVLGGLSS